jgi:uncharacterized membrane protein
VAPGRLVSWESLGRQGRYIAGTGPSAAEIAAFTGSPATEPIRAYAGTLSAAEVEERAELAVADLERAGGFDRGNLLVATTTGSGWLDGGAVDSFEYLTGGDSAVVAMQYSYLPSWLSYLVDQKKARQAGRELFDAVYDRWSRLPPADRPELFVFGLSLGSFGGETAFSGEYDLRNRTAGALFAGPPNFNILYREFTDDQDPGSREVEPVYRGGRTVRFTNDVVAGVAPAAAPWEGTRVLYLQHPSDPIVWWGPSLVWDRAGLAGRAARPRRARRDGLDPGGDLLAGDRRPPPGRRRPGRPRPHLHPRVRRRLGHHPPAARLDPRQGRAAPGDHHHLPVTAAANPSPGPTRSRYARSSR